MTNKRSAFKAVFITSACALTTACGGLQPGAVSKENDISDTPPKEKPAEEPIEIQAPIVAVGKEIASIKNEDFLNELYADNIRLYKGIAKTDYSADFKQAGVQKHVFISTFTAKQASNPIICLDIVEKHGKTFTIAEHYSNLYKAVMHAPHSQLSWCQYGPDMFALVETYETNNDESSGGSAYSEIKLSAQKGVTWTNLLDVIQTADAGETVTQSLSFSRSSRKPWEARIKTAFNHNKPLIVRYFFRIREYVPVGTIPRMTMMQAEHVRGLPATDWDSTPVDLSRRHGTRAHHLKAKQNK